MRDRLQLLLDTLLAVAAWAMFAIALSFLLSRDAYVAADLAGKVRQQVRAQEFDFVTWTLAAVGAKVRQASVDEQTFLPEATRAAVVRQYFDLRRQLDRVEGEIARRYADPDIADPAAATENLARDQNSLRLNAASLQPLAEAVLQEQLSIMLSEQRLTTLGQPVPPVAFQFTALPYALIVSPRDVIRADANLDVRGELTVQEQVALEDKIAKELDVSTLIVPLGGIGTYPTMVAQSSDMNWITSVVAHEWIHNYLTLRPLGLNYMTSPELRTMNETTAEMIGEELGARLMRQYYPDLAPPAPPFDNKLRRSETPPTNQPPNLDFRAEMHTTRARVDALLAAGQIGEAEAYMEARRRFLWDNGYQIRKLNQAYFAFYGAYAAGGGGAAGADPVGGAVRLLRRRSPNIADFVNTMATFSTFEQLERYLGRPAT